MEAPQNEKEQKEEPDTIDELIFRALGRVIITRTPYGYSMTAPREKVQKTSARA